MDASCYETACLIQTGVYELALHGTGPGSTAISRHGKKHSAMYLRGQVFLFVIVLR